MTITQMTIETLTAKFQQALANKNFNTAWYLVGQLDDLVSFDESEALYNQLEVAEAAQ